MSGADNRVDERATHGTSSDAENPQVIDTPAQTTAPSAGVTSGPAYRQGDDSPEDRESHIPGETPERDPVPAGLPLHGQVHKT
jgi:hypothetical protein